LERLIGRVGYIHPSTRRTLSLEFYRIPNHSSAITTHAIDTGSLTTMLRQPEEREKLIHSSEVLPGTRFHAGFSSVGRLRYDISLRRIDSSVYRSMHFARKLKEIQNISSMNRLWRSRLYEVGIIDRDFVLWFGLSGLMARSSRVLKR